MRETNIGTIGKIIVTEQLKNQIDYLHRNIGATEWSGILIYTQSGGDIKKMKNLVFRANNVYLMDIGTSASTDFNYGAETIDLYEKIPEAMEQSIGLTHSHHSMGAFFSGTDLEEIRKNGSAYNYYISLVVDFKETYKCKIAFPSKSVVNIKNDIRGNDGKVFTINTKQEEDTLLVADLDVEIIQTSSVEQWFSARYTEINSKKKAVATFGASTGSSSPVIGFGSKNKYQREIWEDSYNDFESSFPKTISPYRTKPVSCTDDEEFLKAILMGANNSNKTLEEAFISFNKISEEELPMWEDIVDSNMDILHYNVYGNDAEAIIRKNSKSVSKLLDKYKHYNINNNFSVLTDLMEVYAEI